MDEHDYAAISTDLYRDHHDKGGGLGGIGGYRNEYGDCDGSSSGVDSETSMEYGEMDDEEDGGTVNGSSIVGGSRVCDAARSYVCGVAAGVTCFITFACLQSCCHAHPPDEAFAVTTACRR